ncbi:tetratricopeptide repeat protein [Candidatus Microgenomates bacterium]|nr:tetratricopeptide repeat protein [Candidatus Microgenomates bacterium]
MAKMQKNWLWLGVFLFLIFCFCFKTPESEWSQDLGRHLKIGEIIWQTKNIPSTNLFSYPHADFPFINHHWLAEVIFYFVFSLAGNFGLVFLKTILILFGFVLVILAADSKKSWGALLPLWFLASLIFRERLDIRPEFFGFFFFGLFLYLFQKEKKGQTKWLWLLPFIQALWVNIHLSFVFGLFLTGLWLMEKLCTLFLDEVGPPERSDLLRLLRIGLAIFLATLFNPHFLKGALYPFFIFKNYGYQIVENQTIFFLQKMGPNPNLLFFKINLLIGLVSFIFAKKRSVFSFLGFIILSLIAAWQIRHFPFFALFLIFVLIQNLSPVLEKKKFLKIKLFLTGLGVLLIITVSLCYLTNFYYQSHDRNSRFGWSPFKISAEKGADFLLKNASKAKIFNNFDIGSYLDYRLYPQRQVFADSRPEAYPKEFWDEYKEALNEKEKWEDLVEKYNLEVVFFSHTDQTPWAQSFFKQIVKNPDWQIVYLDEAVVIFFKNLPSNLSTITKENILDLTNNFTKHTQFVYLANFCQKVGWLNEEKILLEKALKIEPWSRWANGRLAQIYLSSGNPSLQYKARSFLQKLKHLIFGF